MKLKALTAIIMGLALAGCGGGGNDDRGTGSTTPTGSLGASGNGGNSGADTDNAATPGSAPVSSGGTQFLTQTSQAVQAQEQQSQAVAQKSENPEVTALAQELRNEINVIRQQVTQVSQTNNVTINNNVTAQQQTQINNINNLSGNELDRAYVSGLVDSWRNLLATTLVQARQGTDVQVKQTATANILVVEQRLAFAEELLVKLMPTEYLVQANQVGLLEIQLSQLALQKSTNAQVRQFAQRMIDEHTQMNSRVTAMAQQKNVTLSDTLSAEKQAKVDVMSSYSGADFDKAYMDRNIHVHTKSVSMTSVVAQSSTDADIKALATQNLPMLQAHLQLAQSINTSVQATQLYQLSQNLVTEIQIAQFVQARTNDTQIKALAQQIITQNQSAYTQVVQLSQQTNVTIALTIEPARIQEVRQLMTTRDANADRQTLSLLRTQINQSLQVAQSAQASSDTTVSNVARTRVSVLQSLNARIAQLNNGNGATPANPATSATPVGSGTTGTNTGTSGMTDAGTTTGTGTTGTATTGTATGDGTTTGTVGTGTTGTTTTGTATGTGTGTANAS
jgi:predicted outer membrane protein